VCVCKSRMYYTRALALWLKTLRRFTRILEHTCHSIWKPRYHYSAHCFEPVNT